MLTTVGRWISPILRTHTSKQESTFVAKTAWIAGALVPVAVLLMACAGASPAGQVPDTAAGGETTNDGAGEVLPLAGDFDLRPILSVEELVSRSDVIAVVTPLETLEEYWPADGYGNLVASRFRLRLDKVLKGSAAEGDSIVAHTPGGTFAASFGSTQSQMPRPGEPVVRRQDFSRPFYQVGKPELVFLERIDGGAGLGEFYFDLGPQARYRIVGDVLRSVDTRVPVDPSQLARRDLRRSFVGQTLSAAEATLRPVIAQRAPKP